MEIEEVKQALARVPNYMREGLLAYLDGQPPGDFLRAILENNFYLAVALADSENRCALFHWANVLDVLPSSVWGSKKKVDAHIETQRAAYIERMSQRMTLM